MELIPAEILKTFLVVADLGSFTAAGRLLGLSQSSVSQQIRKLETIAGRRCVDRDTHRVALTPAGESLLGYARAVLESNERLHQHLLSTPLRGRLRLGASEDFVLSALPDVLAAFIRRHPNVDFELRAGLSTDLYDLYDAGQLDLIFVKRRKGDGRGRTAWREAICWTASPGYRLDDGAPLPLLLYPSPSITRAHTLDTLDRIRRPWRIAFTSASLTGLSAAARAGIGLFPHSARLIPLGLTIVPDRSLPKLPDVEFVVIGSFGTDPAVDALTHTILSWSSATQSGIRI